jgi:hypothetical protein
MCLMSLSASASAWNFASAINLSPPERHISMSLPEPVIRNGQQCYDVRFQVRSLQSLEWLYRVKDDYRTVLDVDGIFPYEFEQHIREGGYKRDFKATFDQVQNVARTTEGEFPVTPFIHDVVSAFYYVQDLGPAKQKKGRNYTPQELF